MDASECPPTFGVDHDVVIGLIAGGDSAIRKAVEFAEDNKRQGWQDLCDFNFNANDSLIGIAASGSTPYVIGAIEQANEIGALTAGLTNNPSSELSAVSQYAIVPIVGPEFFDRKHKNEVRHLSKISTQHDFYKFNDWFGES